MTAANAASRYILARDLALRSLDDRPYAVVRRGGQGMRRLSAKELWLALACDGEIPLTETQLRSEALRSLLERDIVESVAEGETASLDPWQRLRVHSRCAACRHLIDCGGGCRVLSMALTQKGHSSATSLYGPDLTRCAYFDGGGEDLIDGVMAKVARPVA